MKKQLFITGLLILLFGVIPTLVIAQKGSIKIFSEIKGVNVYLDETFKGIDVTTIDSVTSGSHYLKISKDSVILYGELVIVNPKTVTTVLLKNSKETQDKLLAAKYPEQEKYKLERLDVMVSTKYITQTTGTTETKGNTVSYFPGYYSGTGTAQTTTTSVTSAVTDWFITHGNSKISEYEFAKLTKNQDVVDKYDLATKQIAEKNLKRAKRSRATMVIVGLGIGILGAVNINNSNIENETGRTVVSIFGIVGAIGGTAMVIGGLATSTKKFDVYASNINLGLISYDEAIRQAKIYNQNLKKELGLPENYEPTE